MHRYRIVNSSCAILDQVGTSCNKPFGVTFSPNVLTGHLFLSRGGSGTPQGKILVRTLCQIVSNLKQWIESKLILLLLKLTEALQLHVILESHCTNPYKLCVHVLQHQCTISLYFSLRLSMSIAELDWPPFWSLDVSKTGDRVSTKCP